MPQALYTINEYITTVRKKTTIWIVFNTVYNDRHAFKKKPKDDEYSFTTYLNKNFTDNTAREEFLKFMKENFAQTKLFEVFDLVDAGYLEYPYLGSIAIDTDIGSDAYTALSEKYGDPYADATVNNQVLWVIELDDAKAFYQERKEALDAEFG